MNIILKRISLVSVSGLLILSTAAGCSLPGLPFGNKEKGIEIIGGVIKKDPSIKKDGYIQANSVKGGGENALKVYDTKQFNRFDKNSLQLLTKQKGLVVSNDSGKNWERKYIYPVTAENGGKLSDNDFNNAIAKNDAIDERSFSVNPANKDNIVIAGKDADGLGKIFTTVNGGKNFVLSYSEVQTGIGVNLISINPKNPNRIFGLLEKGALVRSLDGGVNWQKIKSFKEIPTQMDFIPGSGELYVISETEGLQKSGDDGETWQKVEMTKKASKIGEDQTNGKFNIPIISKGDSFGAFTKFVPVTKKNGNIGGLENENGGNELAALLIADKQLWYSSNILAGVQFEKLPLPLQNEQSNILSVAFNPISGVSNLLVSVDNKLIESTNRGQSWNVNDKINLKNENTDIGNIVGITFDIDNPEIIFLNLSRPEVKKGGLFG